MSSINDSNCQSIARLYVVIDGSVNSPQDRRPNWTRDGIRMCSC